jgi:hypothetical protein
MVAEEVPPVAPASSPQPAPPPAATRVGVKRPREQTNRPVATAGQVRPALDADPGGVDRRPKLEREGRGATRMAPTPRGRPASFPTRPPSLLNAAFRLAAPPRLASPALTAPGIGFTHGMFGTLRSAAARPQVGSHPGSQPLGTQAARPGRGRTGCPCSARLLRTEANPSGWRLYAWESNGPGRRRSTGRGGDQRGLADAPHLPMRRSVCRSSLSGRWVCRTRASPRSRPRAVGLSRRPTSDRGQSPSIRSDGSFRDARARVE